MRLLPTFDITTHRRPAGSPPRRCQDVRVIAFRRLLHLLCNKAGVFAAALLWERTLADWQWVLGRAPDTTSRITHRTEASLARTAPHGLPFD